MKQLLIVDDDREGAAVLGEALAEWIDCAINYAGSGPEALELVAARPQHFDVALIDQNLEDPGMDGIDTMRAIFKLNALLPVLLFTGQELHEESLQAIDEGAYLYLSLQKGDISPSQLAHHCQAAMHDRTRRWQALFQAMSQALHSLDVDHVFATCEQGLNQLGYHSGAIYSIAPGWIMDDTPLGGQSRAIERRSYLRRAPVFARTIGNKTIDLSVQSDIRSACDSDQPITVFRDPDGAERLVVPLKGTGNFAGSSGNLHGLLVLYHRPISKLEQREQDNLASLGKQVSLALQNALAYQQLEYRRATANQILKTNHRILAIEYHTGAAGAILGEFAQTIAEALRFQRVLISTVNEAHSLVEHHGVAGFAPGYWPPALDRAAFEAFHRPEYRVGACYFFPEGCGDAEVRVMIRLQDEFAPVRAPWEWHPGDTIRAEIVSARGKVLGYVTIDQRLSDHRPDINVFEALELFATQIAIAIENLNYQQMIEAIQQVSVKISRTRDRAALFTTVYQQLQQLMYADVMMIGRYSQERDTNHQVEALYRRRLVSQERDLPRFHSAALGMNGYICRNGTPLLFANQQEILDFHRRHDIAPLGPMAKSWMGVPLQVDNRVIGVISLKDYDRENVYSDRDQRLLAILADQIAIALRRIELENDRRNADLRVMTQLGLAMEAGEIAQVPGNQQRAERMILEWACRLTRADYGVILRYDEEDNSLVLSEGYVTHPDRDIAPPPIDSELRLSMSHHAGAPISLSVIAARAKRGMRWSDVRKERNYYPAIHATRSQLSIPLLNPNDGQKLLGVLTIEARRRNTFDRLNRSHMQAIANIATVFFLRAREHQHIRSTLSRYMFDLGNNIIHHSYVTEARGLSTNLETAGRQLVDLLDDLQTLYGSARHIPLAEDIHLDQRVPTRINDVVRRFLESSGTFYHHPTIELRVACYLDDSVIVYANALGLGEALQILVDNAFEVLSVQPYGGHEILISTDSNTEGIVLCVSNTGPPLSEKNLALVASAMQEWEASSHGLVKLKALVGLYGATVHVAQNDLERVTFAITFPRAAAPIAPSSSHTQQQLRQLQRGIASHSALLHARVVSARAPQFQQRSKQVHKKLEDIRSQAELLTADFGFNLYERVQIVLRELLTDFVIAVNRNQPERYRAIPINYQARPEDDVNVYASWVGLREVLRNLVHNARQAILESTAPTQSAHMITISAECERTRVRIHVQNTGSYIPYDIANRLFEYEILSTRGSGRGLLLSNLLLAAFGGSIRLTLNDRARGVRFTIELPRLPVASA